jgi:hypothetical protein
MIRIDTLPMFKCWRDMISNLELETCTDSKICNFNEFPIINVENSTNYHLLISNNNISSSQNTKKIIIEYKKIEKLSIISYYKKINTKYSYFECALIINILRSYNLKGGLFKTLLNNDILNDYDFYILKNKNTYKYIGTNNYLDNWNSKSLLDKINEYNIDLLVFILYKIIFKEDIKCDRITRINFTYTFIYDYNNLKLDINMKTIYDLPTDFYENTIYINSDLELKCLHTKDINYKMKIKLLKLLLNNKNNIQIPINIIAIISSYLDDNYLYTLKLMYNITKRKMNISHESCCDLDSFLNKKTNNINNISKLLSIRIIKLEKQNYKLNYTNCNKELCICRIKNIIDEYKNIKTTISFPTYLRINYTNITCVISILEKIYNNITIYSQKYINNSFYFGKFIGSYEHDIKHHCIDSLETKLLQKNTKKYKEKSIDEKDNKLKNINLSPKNLINKDIKTSCKNTKKKINRYTKFYKENYYNYLYNT